MAIGAASITGTSPIGAMTDAEVSDLGAICVTGDLESLLYGGPRINNKPSACLVHYGQIVCSWPSSKEKQAEHFYGRHCIYKCAAYFCASIDNRIAKWSLG